MSDDYDRDLEFEIIQKAMTTAHLEIPDFGEPMQVPQEVPPMPVTSQDSDSE